MGSSLYALTWMPLVTPPTILPFWLIAFADVNVPDGDVRVLRSMRRPLIQVTARGLPELLLATPTIWPRSFIERASLGWPAASAPRSVTAKVELTRTQAQARFTPFR